MDNIESGMMTITHDLSGRPRIVILHETEHFHIAVACFPDHAQQLIKEMEHCRKDNEAYLLSGSTNDGSEVIIEIEVAHLPEVIRHMKDNLAIIAEFS